MEKIAIDETKLQELVTDSSNSVKEVFRETEKVVVGQSTMLRRILMSFLCDGHILLEGLPGLAKTLTVNTFAKVLDLDFSRIQFTPDLLPSDLVGSMIYNQKTGDFSSKKGPIFSNIVLADEINRAPAKVQSALLEAMAEKQVTIGDETHPLPNPFVVLATQNPIEQEGTYNLPEAQLDRFMFKVKVEYPTKSEEKKILDRMTSVDIPKISKTILPRVLAQAKALTSHIYIDEKLKDYIINIVFTSRFSDTAETRELKSYIQVGASPRASIYLLKAARASAFLDGRTFVSPDDIKEVCYDILRHRLILSYDAEASNITAENVIRKILDAVQVP